MYKKTSPAILEHAPSIRVPSKSIAKLIWVHVRGCLIMWEIGFYIYIYISSEIDRLPVTLSLGHGFKLSMTELVKSPGLINSNSKSSKLKRARR